MPQTQTALGSSETAGRKKIDVRLSPEANLETIASVISTIGGRYGCRTCGLMGIDVHLSGGPVEDQELSKVPGVLSARTA